MCHSGRRKYYLAVTVSNYYNIRHKKLHYLTNWCYRAVVPARKLQPYYVPRNVVRMPSICKGMLNIQARNHRRPCQWPQVSLANTEPDFGIAQLLNCVIVRPLLLLVMTTTETTDQWLSVCTDQLFRALNRWLLAIQSPFSRRVVKWKIY